jgi:hypothetical protein
LVAPVTCQGTGLLLVGSFPALLFNIVAQKSYTVSTDSGFALDLLMIAKIFGDISLPVLDQRNCIVLG